MEQINSGILKLMNVPGGAHMKGAKYDPNADRGEQVFDALLGQKSAQNRSDTAVEKPSNRPVEEKDTEKETVKSEKAPDSKKQEEENCDIAREAACAQIVWLTNGNAADLLITQQQENVAVIEQPMLIGEINDAAEVISEAAQQIIGDMQMDDGIEIPEEMLAQEIMPEQVVETVPQEQMPELQTNVSGQNAEETGVEINVTVAEDEEISGEAAVEGTSLFEDVEAAPVKVAEAPARTEKAPEVEKQVAEKLVDAVENGETKVEIRLDPAELGKLTIELTRSSDGTLNILLNAENTQTRGLLERHMGGLQEALADRGQQNVQITVERGEESQRQDQFNQNNDFRDGSNGRQNEQQHRDDNRSGIDFMQQLRLGLIPLEDEEDE